MLKSRPVERTSKKIATRKSPSKQSILGSRDDSEAETSDALIENQDEYRALTKDGRDDRARGNLEACAGNSPSSLCLFRKPIPEAETRGPLIKTNICADEMTTRWTIKGGA